MGTPSRRFDALERIFWTFVQVVLAGVTVEALNAWTAAEISPVWVPLVAAGFAALKTFVARRIGDPDSAATLPAAPPTPGDEG